MITKNDVVLITGGTGFTGTYLVKKLCDSGAMVRVLAREVSNRTQFEGLP
ncbi:MAG: nucleoside-diphosphate-sugar epimerase, partial [Arenicella sp.]